MGEWKSLKIDSGTGWKEIYRESGTGWKALEWESAYEDFTTFTEVDVAGDRIQKTANHVDHDAYRYETTYLYKDYGAAHFGDFEHKIKVKAVTANNGGYGIIWMLSNDLGSRDQLEDNDKTATSIYLYYTTVLNIYLRESHSGSTYQDGNIDGFGLTEWIYIKIIKNGTAISAYLYSDSTYTTLVDTLSLTLHADHTSKYLYACDTLNTSTSQYLTSDVENFDLG